MSNYSPTTIFADKDGFPTNDPRKIIKGSEFGAEFTAISTMSGTKADLASPTFTGTVTIPTATITTANCENLSVEKATNSGQTDLLIHNTGTGDADAVLKLDSSDTGESEIDFLHDGSLGAKIEYFVDGGSPDLNIKTLTSGSVIDLQPNDVNTLRAAEGVVTVTGRLEVDTPLINADESMLIKRGGTTCGAVRTIVSGGSTALALGSGDCGLRYTPVFSSGTASVAPFSVSSNQFVNGSIDLGLPGAKWDDIYATNGTINTSDANDKQSIEELTEAETRVAQACKGLVRKFKWNSAVEKKGSEARYHFGVMAQDVQAAFEAEGLDAGDYGLFVSNTEEDEDGVEQTRLGVRYTELLAFIIGGLV